MPEMDEKAVGKKVLEECVSCRTFLKKAIGERVALVKDDPEARMVAINGAFQALLITAAHILCAEGVPREAYLKAAEECYGLAQKEVAAGGTP